MYFWKKDTFLLVYLTVMTLAAQEGISLTTVEDSTSEQTQTPSVSESTPSPITEGTTTSEVTLSTTGTSSTTVGGSTSEQTQTTSVSKSSPSPITEGSTTSEVTLSTTGTSSTTVVVSTSKQTQTTRSSKPSPSHTTEEIRTSKVTLFTTVKSTSISTAQTCQDCDCNGSPCFFNQTIKKCQCLCKPPTFGDKCNFVTGSSPADLSGNTPTRKAKISLRLMMDFLPVYGNENSPEYKNLTSILKREISILFRRADVRNFKDVNIKKLRPGSVIADSIAEYNYPNNNTQIQFLNKDLERTLKNIFNDSESFKSLSAALGNVHIEIPEITMEPSNITDITDLQEYVNCTAGFANFTAELKNDTWVCVGPCENNQNYCSKRGQCFNEINGPQCQCDRSNFEEYYGTNCELYRRGAAFYAALFGSLAAFIVIVIVVIVVVVVLHRSSRVHSKESAIYENMPYQENAPGRAI